MFFKRRTDKFIPYFVAFLIFVIYILIQDEMIFNAINPGSNEYLARQRSASNGKGNKASEQQNIEYVRKKTPLIYMHTTRLHTSVMYDEPCEITRSPERFEESDAVVFHAKDLPLPESLAEIRSRHRIVDQLWVYFNLESPLNTQKVPQNEMLFNLTVTPKRSSDIFHPYAYYNRRTEQYSGKIDLKSKTRFIAWCVSNCAVPTRNNFVHLMQRYVTVDVYGKCSKQFGVAAVGEKNSNGCNRFLSQYKFYLAFENSLCEDYVTEKYWGALDRGNVPVIMAANDDTLIPGSYIDAAKFKTVEDLAKYLMYLNRNDDAYLKYFEWRKEYELDYDAGDARRSDVWLPELCDLLLDRDWSKVQTVNISQFYGVEFNCPLEKENKLKKLIERGV